MRTTLRHQECNTGIQQNTGPMTRRRAQPQKGEHTMKWGGLLAHHGRRSWHRFIFMGFNLGALSFHVEVGLWVEDASHNIYRGLCFAPYESPTSWVPPHAAISSSPRRLLPPTPCHFPLLPPRRFSQVIFAS